MTLRPGKESFQSKFFSCFLPLYLLFHFFFSLCVGAYVWVHACVYVYVCVWLLLRSHEHQTSSSHWGYVPLFLIL